MKTKKMDPVIFFPCMFLLYGYGCANVLRADETPRIYINFFDEVIQADNTSSKIMDNDLTTTSSPFNDSVKNTRQRLDLSPGIFKLNHENKTYASVPSGSIFEFDNPSKAYITEISVNESNDDPSTTSKFVTEIINPADFLEPEITKMFFLKAIANLIEHIMEALFAIDDTPKLNDPASFDYDLPPSRNLIKRDLSSAEANPKLSLTRSKTDILSDTSTIPGTKDENKNTESIAISTGTQHDSELTQMQEKLMENQTEQSSHTPSTNLATNHVSSQHISHETTVLGTHTNAGAKEEKTTSTVGVKSHHDIENLPDGKVVTRGKLIALKSLQKEQKSSEDDFNFSDDSSVLNDEMVNKKDTRFYSGVHLAGEHEGNNLFDQDEDNFNNYSGSSSLMTLLLISTTIMIIIIIVALGLGAAYFFRKSQSQCGIQNASNLRNAVA